MTILVWLAPIPVAALFAIAWGTWRSRPRGPQDAYDSVEDYQRFRTAIGGPSERRVP